MSSLSSIRLHYVQNDLGTTWKSVQKGQRADIVTNKMHAARSKLNYQVYYFGLHSPYLRCKCYIVAAELLRNMKQLSISTGVVGMSGVLSRTTVVFLTSYPSLPWQGYQRFQHCCARNPSSVASYRSSWRPFLNRLICPH